VVTAVAAATNRSAVTAKKRAALRLPFFMAYQ